MLLETEVVTCIDIDAGNNKWIGTFQASGLGGLTLYNDEGIVMLQMEMEFPKLTTMKNRRYPCNEESIIPQNKK